MLTKDNVQDLYPLTPMQEGMLVEHARDPASADYIEQFALVVDGELAREAVHRAFAALVERHDVLRTIFSFRKTDLPRQVVLKSREPAVGWLDLGELPAGEQAAALERFKLAERVRGFDLSADLLVRLHVVRLAPLRHQLVITFHHIILDGWSFGPLLEEFFAAYEAFTVGGTLPAQPAAVPYRRYIDWLQQQDAARAQEHWASYLADYQEEAGPPYFDLRHDGSAGVAEHNLQLGPDLTARLAAVAREHRLTPSNVFQAAWGVLLQKVNGRDDVVFGTVVSGRPPALAGIERAVGLYINTQPLRVRAEAQTPFVEVALKLQQDLAAASAFEHHPLAAVQAASPLRQRLLNHVVTFENFPLSEQMRRLTAASPVRVTEVQVFQAAKFDFHVVVFPGDDLRVSFVFNPQRYPAEAIACLARSLEQLLQAVAAAPATPVAQLPACSPVDARRVLREFNATRHEYPDYASLIDLFEAQVRANPAAVALRSDARCWTYVQLQGEALALASRLREVGICKGGRVALLAPRGPQMVRGMLAALYCGAAYVPLEMHTSDERLQLMLADAGITVLCNHGAARKLEGVTQLPLEVDGPAGKPMIRTLPADAPAYVMYTSGSTGTPKGCVVSHRNIVRLVRNSDFLPFGAQLRVLWTGSPAFDASTLEVWGPLLNGGEVVLVDDATLLDARLLREAIARHGATTMWLTTALFNQLCDGDPALFAPLQHLLVGGDVLSIRHVEQARRACPGLQLINGYGPTENTTFSTTHRITRTHADRIPIGRPIAHSTCYVLDACGLLLPPGAWGELCVGGDGVALGYLNRADLTREKFIPDPFARGGRLYRTGDIARWLPDGTLDLRGRNDNQVKIRGFRVELGEIERALATHPKLAEVAVVAHEGPGGKQLHAFYTADAEVPVAELRAALSALPSYMVPAFCMRLERMPITTNGKLDRRALPVAESLATRAVPAGAAPRSQSEVRVAQIVREVLGVDDVGVHDNFFEAGANSLNLIAIHNRVKQAFEREIPLALLFEHTSISLLARHLDADPAVEAARLAAEAQALDEGRNALLRNRKLMIRNLEQA